MGKLIKYFVIALAIAMAINILLSGHVFERETYNLNNYVVISVEGDDGNGTISAEIDYYKLMSDYYEGKLDNMVFVVDPRMVASMALEDANPYVLIYEPTTNLSNGDIVEFSWKINKEGVEEVKDVIDAKIEFSDFIYTVSGLEPAEK